MVKKIVIWSVAAAAFYLLLNVFVGHYHIPQNGMYPGLPANSDLFCWKFAYSDPSSVKRGDIIIFRREQNGVPYIYVWRVIGLPGDKVATSGQTLSVNGEPVKRDYLRDADSTAIFREAAGDASYEVAFEKSPRSYPPDASITIPPAAFFVMGDNRFNAVDSRYFGPIPFTSIIGRKI